MKVLDCTLDVKDNLAKKPSEKKGIRRKRRGKSYIVLLAPPDAE